MSMMSIVSTMSTMSSSRCSRTGSSGAWWTRSPSTLWTSSCRRGRRGRLDKTCCLCWLLNATGKTIFLHMLIIKCDRASTTPFQAFPSRLSPPAMPEGRGGLLIRSQSSNLSNKADAVFLFLLIIIIMGIIFATGRWQCIAPLLLQMENIKFS